MTNFSRVNAWTLASVLFSTWTTAASAGTHDIQIIALDCLTPELPNGLPVASDNIPVNIWPSVGINNNGQIAFGDWKGVYTYNAGNQCVSIVGNINDTVEDRCFRCFFDSPIRINDNGEVLWFTKLNLRCSDPPPTCVACPPGPPCAQCNGDPMEILKGSGGVIQLITKNDANTGISYSDVELLENGEVVFEWRDDPAASNPCLTCFSKLWRTDGVNSVLLAETGGPVLDNLGRPLGVYGPFGPCQPGPVIITSGFFKTISPGVDNPLVFSNRVDINGGDCTVEIFIETTPASIETSTSLHKVELAQNDTFVDQDGIIQTINSLLFSSNPDVGCVECFADEHRTIVFGTRLDSSPAALLERNIINGETKILLRSDRTYSGLGGGQLDTSSLLFSGVVNNIQVQSANGRAVFTGQYEDSNMNNKEALFLCEGIDQVEILVQQGDLLPCPHDDMNYVRFESAVINNQGQVAFWAETSDGNGGIFLIELGSTCACLGDLNTDGSRNGPDIQGFVSCLIGAQCSDDSLNCACGDYDGSGVIDTADIAGFVADLLSPLPCSQ